MRVSFKAEASPPWPRPGLRGRAPSCLWGDVSRRLEGHFANHVPGCVMPMAVPSPGGCPPAGGCNETRMLEKLPLCGKAFADMMRTLDAWKRCNLSEFIV